MAKPPQEEEYEAKVPESFLPARFNNYVLNLATLNRRVEASLTLLQDALAIWNRTVAKPYFSSAPRPPMDKLTNCRVFDHRRTLLESLDPVEASLEIGVLQGAFSRRIIDTLSPRHHTMIDTQPEMIDLNLFQGLDVEIKILKGKSSDVLKTLPNSSFDFIYIDGAHDEDSVAGDLTQSTRLLRPGGVVMLNDYCIWSPNQAVVYGVMAAVNKFLAASSYEMVGISIDGTGASDVALRRMA